MSGRTYEAPSPLTKEEAARRLLSDDERVLVETIVAAALSVDDGPWLEERCLDLCRHGAAAVRGAAATALGHVARLHGLRDVVRARQALEALKADPRTQGRAEDALDDLDVFVR